MLSVITFTLLVLRISTTSSASTVDIPLDPGHTDIPFIPGHTIPLDIPLIFRLHTGEFFGESIRFCQTPEGELLATIFETFSNAS